MNTPSPPPLLDVFVSLCPGIIGPSSARSPSGLASLNDTVTSSARMATRPVLPVDSLQSVLGADARTTAAAAALCGVLFHLTIRKIEIDYYIFHLFALSAGVLSGLFGAYLSAGKTLLEAGATTCLVAVSFNTGLALSIAVYRLLFHPLRSFPGPLGAKLSRFYTVKLAAKNLQYQNEVADMVKRYGDVVRTGLLYPRCRCSHVSDILCP